jgi:hypothetical protein
LQSLQHDPPDGFRVAIGVSMDDMSARHGNSTADYAVVEKASKRVADQDIATTVFLFDRTR